jgi:thiol-disulfide isomerase/thioredoxin
MQTTEQMIDVNVYTLKSDTKLYTYTAEWCNPCKKIKPTIQKLTMNFNLGVSMQIDKKTLREEVNQFIPFFKLVRNGPNGSITQTVIQTSDEEQLTDFINKALITFD